MPWGTSGGHLCLKGHEEETSLFQSLIQIVSSNSREVCVKAVGNSSEDLLKLDAVIEHPCVEQKHLLASSDFLETPVKGFFSPPLSETRTVYCIMKPAEGKSCKSKQSLSGAIKTILIYYLSLPPSSSFLYYYGYFMTVHFLLLWLEDSPFAKENPGPSQHMFLEK